MYKLDGCWGNEGRGKFNFVNNYFVLNKYLKFSEMLLLVFCYELIRKIYKILKGKL